MIKHLYDESMFVSLATDRLTEVVGGCHCGQEGCRNPPSSGFPWSPFPKPYLPPGALGAATRS